MLKKVTCLQIYEQNFENMSVISAWEVKFCILAYRWRAAEIM